MSRSTKIKISLISFAIVALLVCIVLISLEDFPELKDTASFVEHRIGPPFPSRLQLFKTIHLVLPSRDQEGWCVAAYTITAADYDLLRYARHWTKVRNIPHEVNEDWEEAWPGTSLDLEAYSLVVPHESSEVMVVSPDHRRLMFRLQQ